jgi:hypothetical protein
MLGISIAPKRVEAMTQIATLITNVPGQKLPVLRFNPKPFAGAIKIIRFVAPDSEMQIGQSFRADSSFASQFSNVKIRKWPGQSAILESNGTNARPVRMGNGEETGPIQEWKELEGRPGRALKLPNGQGWVHTHNRKGKKLMEWVNRARRSEESLADRLIDSLTSEGELWHYDPARYEALKDAEWQEGLKEKVKNIEGQMAKDVLDTYWSIGSTKQKDLWVEQLEEAADNGVMIITGDTLDEAEELIRQWLTRINDICRIASFFHADGGEAGELMEQVVDTSTNEPLINHLEQMFADENLPEIEVKLSPALHTHSMTYMNVFGRWKWNSVGGSQVVHWEHLHSSIPQGEYKWTTMLIPTFYSTTDSVHCYY